MRRRAVAVGTGLLVLLALSGCLRDTGGADGVPRDIVDGVRCPTEDLMWSEDVVVDTLVGGPAGDQGQSFVLDVAGRTDWTAEDAGCVRAIRVVASWTNGPTAGADLYVGVTVPGTDTEVLGHDTQQYVLDGEHTESVFAPTAVDGFNGAALLEGLDVTLHTQWASLSQDGLPVNLTATLVVP